MKKKKMAALLMSLVLTVPFQTQVYAQGLQNIETEETETAEEETETEETETAEADTVSESTPAANSVYQDIVYDVIGHGAAGMGVYIEEYMGSAADLASHVHRIWRVSGLHLAGNSDASGDDKLHWKQGFHGLYESEEH